MEKIYHYGDILKALGENFMAEIYWRKALEKGYDAGRIERRITESTILDYIFCIIYSGIILILLYIYVRQRIKIRIIILLYIIFYR